jgi:hypothetical protein
VTDLDRVELAIRTTAEKINGHTQSAIKVWFIELADEIQRIAAAKRKASKCA